MPTQKTDPGPEASPIMDDSTDAYPRLAALAIAVCLLMVGLILTLSAHAIEFDAVYRGF